MADKVLGFIAYYRRVILFFILLAVPGLLCAASANISPKFLPWSLLSVPVVVILGIVTALKWKS